MLYGDFIDRVQERAHLDNWKDTITAVEATLKSLGERLTDTESARLAAELPPAIGRFLTVVDSNQEFDLDEFYEHVAQREALEPAASREHVQAVLSVVEEAIRPGEVEDVLSHLPAEFQGLFKIHGD